MEYMNADGFQRLSSLTLTHPTKAYGVTLNVAAPTQTAAHKQSNRTRKRSRPAFATMGKE